MVLTINSNIGQHKHRHFYKLVSIHIQTQNNCPQNTIKNFQFEAGRHSIALHGLIENDIYLKLSLCQHNAFFLWTQIYLEFRCQTPNA